MTPSDHELARQRAKARAMSAVGKRWGYLCVAISIVSFGIGAATRFTPTIMWAVLAPLVLSAFLLIPAVIIGYGVAKAEREEPIPPR